MTRALLLCLFACSSSTEAEPPPGPRKPPAPPPPPAEQLPDGWLRVDLRELSTPLPASVVVPKGTRLTSERRTCTDRDGLEYAATAVTVEHPTTHDQLTLSTCPQVGFEMTTLDAAKAAYASAGTEVGKTDEAPTGEWALTVNGDAVIGWSPRAHVMCRAHFTKDPTTLRKMCTSLAPSGTPFTAVPDPALTWREIDDRAALDVIARVQRASVRDDRAAFLELVDPDGARVQGQQLSVAQLGVALERGLQRYLHLLDCTAGPHARLQPAHTCRWSPVRSDDRIALVISAPTETYPHLMLAKTRHGWRIVEIALERRGPH
jgi:hypothetical protein